MKRRDGHNHTPDAEHQHQAVLVLVRSSRSFPNSVNLTLSSALLHLWRGQKPLVSGRGAKVQMGAPREEGAGFPPEAAHAGEREEHGL